MARVIKFKQWVDSLADRLGVTIWGLVAGSLAIVAAGFGGWWALASPQVTAVEELLPNVGNAPQVAVESVSVPVDERIIVVHVDGAVEFPGVPELAEGTRVHDAIHAAAGLTVDADRSRLNLAAPLSDGQRIYVPKVGETVPMPLASGDIADSVAGGLVNVNTADQALLETLPGVGPSIASAIINYRQSYGNFSQIEDLIDVPGIGDAKLAQILSLVTK